MAEIDTKEYTFTVNRFLSDEERSELSRTYRPKIEALNSRYTPQIDISAVFPARAEYLDFLRGSWMLDKRDDKPPYDNVRDAVAFGFGCLVEKQLGMRWAIIEDVYGESLSLVWRPDAGTHGCREISFPPFNYLEKRRGVQNVEVCIDMFRKLCESVRGTPYPG